jgi:hypothetical protein
MRSARFVGVVPLHAHAGVAERRGGEVGWVAVGRRSEHVGHRDVGVGAYVVGDGALAGDSAAVAVGRYLQERGFAVLEGHAHGLILFVPRRPGAAHVADIAVGERGLNRRGDSLRRGLTPSCVVGHWTVRRPGAT